MAVKARVRGIYSTALSKILLDNGIELVDVSPVIASRLGIDERRGLPADVTVKTENDNPSQIIVLGFPESVEEVSEILEMSIPGLIMFKPPIGLYASFKTRVLGFENRECVVESPLGKALLVDYVDCQPGREVYVSVIKLPIGSNEKLVVSERVRVVGKYAILGRGTGVSFSNFIKNKERVSQLLEISAKYLREGYSIRWRSNADEANLTDIMSEIPELIDLLNEVLSRLREAPLNTVVYEGELVRIYELTYVSKLHLDSVRNKVVPTVYMHHLLKSSEVRDDGYVELADMLTHSIPEDISKTTVLKWLLSKVCEKGEVVIEHRKLDRRILLGKAVVQTISDLDKAKISLKRLVKSIGIYDGINVKKEPGDIITSELNLGRWSLIHRYWSKDGKLKGIYANINTPPEILPSGRVKYIDLETDLIFTESEGCRIIDTDGFRKLLSEGLLSQDIISNVIKEIDALMDEICSATYLNFKT